MGELSMRKQCIPGYFLSAHAPEPGNEAKHGYWHTHQAWWNQWDHFSHGRINLEIYRVQNSSRPWSANFWTTKQSDCTKWNVVNLVVQTVNVGCIWLVTWVLAAPCPCILAAWLYPCSSEYTCRSQKKIVRRKGKRGWKRARGGCKSVGRKVTSESDEQKWKPTSRGWRWSVNSRRSMTGELGQSVTAEGACPKHCPTNSVNKWPTKFQTLFCRLRVTDSSMYAGFRYALGMTTHT